MSWFEKKFGKYAISNLSLVMIACTAVGYVLQNTIPGAISYLTLNPYEILFHGQVWRIFTWILNAPSGIGLFTLLISMLFFYSIGTSMERTWGTYRYNVYLLGGILFTVIGSFLAMAICYLLYGSDLSSAETAVSFFAKSSMMFSTYFINMSVFLAYAATYPEAQVLLMFVIPVKVKWMGILAVIMTAAEFVSGVGLAGYNVFYRMSIAASLIHFVIFWFLSGRRRMRFSPKQVVRRQKFQAQSRAGGGATRHKCAICGRTDKDDPTLEFRFCSKCNGNYEYCQDHLFTHEHVK